MTQQVQNRRSLTALVLAVAAALMLAAAPLQAQDAGKASNKSKPAAKNANSAAVKRPRGRLPAYYGKVVSPAQRTEIYTIQTAYREKIAALRKQLEELTSKRDAEVEAVLSDEQRQKVDELRTEARARRSSGAKPSAEQASADSSAESDGG